MTKTPDETKKGLECCQDNQSCTKYDETQCPYYDVERCVDTLLADALALIQQLERDKTWAGETSDMLREENKRLEALVPRWISVEDEQKPMHGRYYLCVCTLPNDPEHKFDFISVRWWNATTGNGYVDRPHFSDEGVEGMIVTHWMSLPSMEGLHDN